MIRYMLDTNAASHAIRGSHPAVIARLASEPLEAITVSAVTEAELRYGAVKRGSPDGLVRRIAAFLDGATVLGWSSDVAVAYADLRGAIESAGLALSPLDTMIAAHAFHERATLVSADRAFARLGNRIALEDWTKG